MNTANKLTILRVFMIPVFLLVLYLDVPNANYWALNQLLECLGKQ